MQTAYAYARFSSDNQREESIDAQVRAIREYCFAQGIQIIRIFKDEAVSARTAQRPAFQELFGLVKEHPADLLVVHKLDRFARNRADAAFYRSKLKEAGMRLVSVLERLDDSPESIIMEGILESMNEYYSANLSRETKKGLKENILKGKRNGGACPRGYTIVDQHLIANEDAPKVTACFRAYAERRPYSEMVALTGWNKSTIHSMLQNEVYRGVLVSGENRFDRAHEPLVDEKTWEMCQMRMRNNRLNAANRAKVDYMLSGMCVCGVCGKTMNGLTGSRYHYYTCRTKGCHAWRKETLEQRVVGELAEYLTPTDETKERFYRLVSERVNNLERVEKAKKTNQEVSKRISRILNAVQYADEEDARYLMEQAKSLKNQLVPVPEAKEVSRAACDAYIDSFKNLSEKSYKAQKLTVRRLIQKIVVKTGEFIYYMTGNTDVFYSVNNGLK